MIQPSDLAGTDILLLLYFGQRTAKSNVECFSTRLGEVANRVGTKCWRILALHAMRYILTVTERIEDKPMDANCILTLAFLAKIDKIINTILNVFDCIIFKTGS
jgi:hypothetical protein